MSESSAAYENIISSTVGLLRFRVWCARTATGPLPGEHHNLLILVLTKHGRELSDASQDPMATATLLHRYLSLHGVDANAIEVQTPFGGCVFYPLWP